MSTKKEFKNIFILGIKGAAMANIALILKKMGREVMGSDTNEEFITDEQLKQNNILVINSFDAGALPEKIDLVLYSAAHGGLRNPQVKEALRRKIAVMHQVEFMGNLLSEFHESIAVCGTHGKTTTSAMLSHCLLKLETKPSYLVGTSSFNGHYGGDFNGKDYFVIEADEYGMNPPEDKTPKFHYLHPNYCLATNIDFDHPDVYSNITETKEAFFTFFSGILEESLYNKLFLCADDTNLMEVAQRLPPMSYETYGYSSNADLQITQVSITEETSTCKLLYKSHEVGIFSFRVFGGKHLLNAAGVVLMLLHLGFDPEDITDAIQDFAGAKRRFELVQKIKKSYLFDDYAHHPEEIKSTLQTAKERFKGRRIVVVFQPHTYSRTEALKEQFIESLSIADNVILAPIFGSAREQESAHTISSKDLVVSAVSKSYNNFQTYTTPSEFETMFRSVFTEGDVVFTMGAGDVYKMKDDIIKLMY